MMTVVYQGVPLVRVWELLVAMLFPDASVRGGVGTPIKLVTRDVRRSQ